MFAGKSVIKLPTVERKSSLIQRTMNRKVGNDNDSSKYRNNWKFKGKCNGCQKTGHKARDCRSSTISTEDEQNAGSEVVTFLMESDQTLSNQVGCEEETNLQNVKLRCWLDSANLTETEEKGNNLWHRRFGHLIKKYIENLKKNDMVNGMDSNYVCDPTTPVGHKNSNYYKFVAGCETQFQKTVEAIRCGQGDEYTGRNFIDFCNAKGLDIRICT